MIAPTNIIGFTLITNKNLCVAETNGYAIGTVSKQVAENQILYTKQTLLPGSWWSQLTIMWYVSLHPFITLGFSVVPHSTTD